MDFILQPNYYGTSKKETLKSLLEKIWITDLTANNFVGKGTLYILSGFSNFNGGIRFYNHIEEHIAKGGECRVILGGSTSQNMSSQQVVTKLLEIGCRVAVVNRKAIFHAKCYGYQYDDYKSLVVSSGNFTRKGLDQNIEASLLLENEDFTMKFDWNKLFAQIEEQKIEYWKASLDKDNPVWKLLFDESHGKSIEETPIEQTLVVTLSANDTSRIEGRVTQGTQYFFLSKDNMEFFPPLNMKNQRGSKNTYQTLVNLNYIDLNVTDVVRVSFEADNNSDVRLGTGRYMRTKIASKGDMAAITRKNYNSYEIRIFKKDTIQYDKFIQYATTSIGNRGKRYGYLPNKTFLKLLEQLI